MFDSLIKNVTDVPGVEGVCLLTAHGQFIYRKMSALFVEELYEDVSRRVMSIYETIDDNFLPCEDFILKYPQKWIFLRRSDSTILLLMAHPQVNAQSVRMASNLVMKHMTDEMVRELSEKPRYETFAEKAPPPVKTLSTPKPQPATGPSPLSKRMPNESPAAPTGPRSLPPGERTKKSRTERPSRSYRGTTY